MSALNEKARTRGNCPLRLLLIVVAAIVFAPLVIAYILATGLRGDR